MGKASIIGGGAAGLYQVIFKYKYDRISAEISSIDQKISAISAEMASADPARQIFLKARIAHLSMRKEFLLRIKNQERMDMWCADLSENLSGDVGTAEIPNESFNILPGFNGNSYSDDHGLVESPIENTESGSVFNFAIRPWWQKFKPLFRYGKITSIDKQNDICNLNLLPAISSQQININQSNTLTDVPIVYMDCNAAAFDIGDIVLIRFTDQEWSKPIVIGFRDHPKPCGSPLLDGMIMLSAGLHFEKSSSFNYFCLIGIGTINPRFCIVWNPITNAIEKIFDPVGGAEISQPIDCLNNPAFDRWYAAHGNVEGFNCYSESYVGRAVSSISVPTTCGASVSGTIDCGCPDMTWRGSRICAYSTSPNPNCIDPYSCNGCMDDDFLQIWCDGLGEYPTGNWRIYSNVSQKKADAISKVTGQNYSGYSKKLTVTTNAAAGQTTCIRTSWESNEGYWQLDIECDSSGFGAVDFSSCSSSVKRTKVFPPNFQKSILLTSSRTDEIFDFKAKFLEKVMIQLGVEEHQGSTAVAVGMADYYADGAINHDPRSQQPNAALSSALSGLISYARTGLPSNQTLKYLFFEPNYISSGAQYGYFNIWFCTR